MKHHDLYDFLLFQVPNQKWQAMSNYCHPPPHPLRKQDSKLFIIVMTDMEFHSEAVKIE